MFLGRNVKTWSGLLGLPSNIDLILLDKKLIISMKENSLKPSLCVFSSYMNKQMKKLTWTSLTFTKRLLGNEWHVFLWLSINQLSGYPSKYVIIWMTSQGWWPHKTWLTVQPLSRNAKSGREIPENYSLLDELAAQVSRYFRYIITHAIICRYTVSSITLFKCALQYKYTCENT